MAEHQENYEMCADLRLSPRDFRIVQMLSAAAIAYVVAGNSEKAIAFDESAVARAPEHPLAYRNLAIALANLGRFDEAKAAFNSFVRLRASYSVEGFRMTHPFKDPKDFERIAAGLRPA